MDERQAEDMENGAGCSFTAGDQQADGAACQKPKKGTKEAKILSQLQSAIHQQGIITSIPMPMALTTITTKCFKKLVLTHIPPDQDTHQFSYQAKDSTEDAIATVLHTTLTHLGEPDHYGRMLLMSFCI